MYLLKNIIMNKNVNCTPTFSVIIPIFNVEKFLSKCIESILSQSYPNWELILVNDGSSDKSPQICNTFASKDSRIKVINKSNQGVSKARNSGLDIARGKYICFVDADDIIAPTLFETLLPFTKKEIDCVVYGYDRIHNGKLEEFVLPDKRTTDIESTYLDSFIWELKYYNLFVPLWNKVYKRNIIECHKLRNEKDISINEDLIFNQQFFHYIKTASYINLPLYHYTLFSTNNCLSKRFCDPQILLQVSDVIKQTNFQDSSFTKLALFDKFFYWDFLRLSYLNSFLLPQYSRHDRLKIINIFLSHIRQDSDYKQYLTTLGKVKSFIYQWKSKYLIYLYHITYQTIKKYI